MKRPSARPRGAAQTTHVARKRFGQHFLIDAQIIHGIVDCIAPEPGDRLVEIGPGLGALTWALLERVPRLAAVEIDRDLAARWRQQSPDRVELIEADALTFDFASLGADLRLVGNLPYNISTPLLFHLMDVADRVRDQHFMLQKEVIDRMVATPGGRDFGRLSVMLQWRYHMVNLLDVPPDSFDPPPKVDSAVVRMTPLSGSALQCVDRALLSALVTAAFSQRRKLLRHSLGPWLDQHGYGGHFDLQRRAEEVSTAEYVALAQAIPAGRP
ncbi:16S rRNA (adenine(1518)-N(6)/adenine(1519)-N(6))-dimethyltransferase RsmA [Thiomonas bhubaneswarensis]|uniref:Ribosomal RNA small subunit methyltransferase A n=1 Tax=Thiomonas bhubaneswarensis TaxID=339866 RepID=A0A0K6HST0_9BURK|nr:16S rRNA (adenine(1518)-N(6)/adenine(1519)-N(6))-dimethyltransferase RsmA [Thiomonas bhubaneswarensis]CUA93954.1 dimethyladenosine transferase [Thiomonas bhubaneswarensis]